MVTSIKVAIQVIGDDTYFVVEYLVESVVCVTGD